MDAKSPSAGETKDKNSLLAEDAPANSSKAGIRKEIKLNWIDLLILTLGNWTASWKFWKIFACPAEDNIFAILKGGETRVITSVIRNEGRKSVYPELTDAVLLKRSLTIASEMRLITAKWVSCIIP